MAPLYDGLVLNKLNILFLECIDILFCVDQKYCLC